MSHAHQCDRSWPVSPQSFRAKGPSVRCTNIVVGRKQVCEDCRARAKLCQYPGCGKPHGGPPHTTRYCDVCRSKVRRKPNSPRNPKWTEAEDQILRDLYTSHGYGQIAGKVREAFPTRPDWATGRRAQLLGLATKRKKEPRWSPEEDAVLETYGWMSPERIAMRLKEAGFLRTTTSVSLRLRRTEVRTKIDGMTARGFARMLSVDDHAVTGWIHKGLLSAEKKGYGAGNEMRDQYHITTGGIRSFFLTHPDLVDFAKLERNGNKLWFLEIVTGGRISETTDVPDAVATAPVSVDSLDRTVALYGERVTLPALADISGRSVAVLLHCIDGQGMGVEQAAFGQDGEVPLPHEPDPVDVELGMQLQILAKKCRAGAQSIAVWADLPEVVVEHALAGTLPMVTPALAAIVEKLHGEIRIIAKE